MGETEFDCVVVGGGPGGYVAAIRARQLGMKTAVVEREELGGICLNWGCIPTKALLRTAEVHHLIQNAEAFGLRVGEVVVDLEKVVARSRRVAGRLSAGVKQLMKKNEVQVIEGHGRLAGPGRLAVEAADGATSELRAPHILLATGARARTLPGLEPDGQRIWTYKEAMLPEVLPRRLLVVGSGAIGIEFASFYHDLGSEVTVVEILPQILPAEDAEIAKAVRRSLEKRGISIHSSARLVDLAPRADEVAASLELVDGSRQELLFDRTILAVGITGNVEALGLEGTGVRVEKGHIVVGDWLETGEPGVYAIGDVAGPPWLAHKASHEGVLCVERIAGLEGLQPLDPLRVPACTYCRPQVASVGLTEAAAKERGHAVRIGRFPLRANGKALAVGETEGLMKTVFDAKTGELLGAHLFGPEVTEMIQGFAIAQTLETTEAELMHTVFPHPTLSESMHESVLDAFGRALHF
jgi:dihydrolipoamide dehydrogenase